jgi:hypothetical protein
MNGTPENIFEFCFDLAEIPPEKEEIFRGLSAERTYCRFNAKTHAFPMDNPRKVLTFCRFTG